MPNLNVGLNSLMNRYCGAGVLALFMFFSFNIRAEIQDYSDICLQQYILLSNDMLCCDDSPTNDGYYQDYSCFRTDYTGWLTINDTDCINKLRNVGLCTNSSYNIITSTDPQLTCYSGGGSGVGGDCSHVFEAYFNRTDVRMLATATTCNNMYAKVQSEAAHLILEHCYGSIADSPYVTTGSKLAYCPQQNQYLSGETKLTKKTDLQRVINTDSNPYCKTCPTVDGYDGINFSYNTIRGKTSITDCIATMSPSTQTTSDDTGTYEMSLQSSCSYNQ